MCILSDDCFYKVTQSQCGTEVGVASVGGEILSLAGTYDYTVSRMDD